MDDRAQTPLLVLSFTEPVPEPIDELHVLVLPVDPLADEPAFPDEYGDDLRARGDVDDYAPSYADDLEPDALAPDSEIEI